MSIRAESGGSASWSSPMVVKCCLARATWSIPPRGSSKITVGWAVAGTPPFTRNRIEWGTVAGSFPKATASSAKAPYQVPLVVPKMTGVVYLRVHLITPGGLHGYSDVQQILVP